MTKTEWSILSILVSLELRKINRKLKESRDEKNIVLVDQGIARRDEYQELLTKINENYAKAK